MTVTAHSKSQKAGPNGPRSPPTGEAKRQGTAKNQTPNPAHPNRALIHIHLRGQVTAHVREEPQVLR